MVIQKEGIGMLKELFKNEQKNIDSSNMQIHIRLGKGNKDRYTILSKVNLNILREYWRLYKPGIWLFPGINPIKHLTTRSSERVFEQSKQKSAIRKEA